MPFLSPDTLSIVDVVLLLIIVIGMPLESEFSRGRMKALILSGTPGARRRLYRGTILLLWGLTLPILLVWLFGSRNWADLGFGVETGWMSWAGWALAVLPAGFFLGQFVAVKARPAFRSQMREELNKMADALYFMPRTKAEHSLFRLTGITAGITEEIIFRGYLLWSLGLIMPLWAAAAISLAVFVFLHLYQGLAGLGSVLMIGAIMTAIVLLSGSLWPAIALHIFVDVINNDTVWTARTGEDAAPTA